MILTLEQRQLLSVYTPWKLTNVLASVQDRAALDAAISDIKSGMESGTRRGEPEWLQRYETRDGRIYGGSWDDQHRVTVTMAQLTRWALEVPAEVRAELAEVRAAKWAERNRTRKWCGCHDPGRCEDSNRGDPLWGDRYHYSDTEYQEHLSITWELRDRERSLLAAALGLGDEPVGQMDLFEGLMGGPA
ncbi:hypothetical protein SEA_GODPHATHER_55 [Mycobacterium phage GodPhather]|uniref:Uncharacterized protein n=1 Tax=Mycobacterium phage Jeon TaxID=2108123 RepID=A0A2P1JRI7_9CAUD|nr:hypothetical protein PQB70_gp54 [Mycobacterium phage Jeon]AVO21757.1 hypothetical protein SEA_JEON_54 [Mycobacterium phage Jeon]QBP32628.1 hypothetical protein SEA_GODPHATHER_55 [Mycobacterium phage GodPhather]